MDWSLCKLLMVVNKVMEILVDRVNSVDLLRVRHSVTRSLMMICVLVMQ